MGLFDLPEFDPREVAAFCASERVAAIWYRRAALRGLGAPKLACLECIGEQVTLYDDSRSAVFVVPASSVGVATKLDVFRLEVEGHGYRLTAVDAAAIRRRGKPARHLAYMEHFQVLDRVPGMGAFNDNMGIKGASAREGASVALWKLLLIRRGAREL